MIFFAVLVLASVVVELGDFTQSLPVAKSGRFRIKNVYFAPGLENANHKIRGLSHYSPPMKF